MKTKSLSVIAFLVLGLSLANISSVSAREGSDDTTEVHSSASHNTSEPEQRGDNFVTNLTSKTVSVVRDDLQDQLEDKRTAAQQRVEAKKAEVKEKLADKRLQACEKREAKINAIIDRTATQAEKHLGVFEKIEERVKTFYTDKKLTVENYETLVAAVDEKHVAAVAAVDELKANDFSCDTADASNPSSLMKELAHSKNDALKEYRTALKDLIVAIKGASSADGSTETETETQTEPATPTETESTEGTN